MVIMNDQKAQKWPFWALLAIRGHHKIAFYHGYVVCPLEKDQKCGTDQKSWGQNVDLIKIRAKILIFAILACFLTLFTVWKLKIFEGSVGGLNELFWIFFFF